jgi:TolA-binding protein
LRLAAWQALLVLAALGASPPGARAATQSRAQAKKAAEPPKDATPAVPEPPTKSPPAATEPLRTSCGPQTEAAQSAARMKGLFSKLPEPSRDGGAALDPERVNELLGIHQTYQRESVDYRDEVRHLVEKRFGERRSQLSDSYEHAIHDREILERQDRKAAIALFEEFLKRYPTDPTYSADASFRLAELYYERGQDDYNLQLEAYQQQSKDFQAGKIKEEPHTPSYDFRDAVALYRHMLAQWPDYRLDDAIYYLLGYCLEQQNDREAADLAFAGLIEHYPKSRFVPEAWLRQGESYFDAVGGDPSVLLQRAAAAYLHVLEFPDQPLYDKAIYKLGWTYYRLDDFPNAVASFARLLDYYQARAKKTGVEKPGDMQNEAMQYMAISFADEKWGSVDKAVGFFQGLGGRPYEKEIFRRIGDVFYDQTRNGDAVAAYRVALTREPNAPDAPQIQAKIVQAFERDRAFDKQTVERERLVANYAEGTPWYRINKNNSEAVIAARQLTERALRDAALYHIQQAIAFKKDGKVEPAFTEFKTAAAAFGEYLKHYPHTKDVYDLTYYYADALYNSLQFKEAARQYEIVRDMAGEHQYQQPAAHDAVLSLQNELDREQQAHQLPLRPVLKSTDRKGAVKAEALPPLYRDLVRDSDAFVNMFPTDPLAPAIAYRAAESFYVFNQFDEARCRFRDIIAHWPRNEVAQYAANLTIETYLATQDWANVTAATGELLASGGVVQKGSELEKTLVKFQLAGIFKLAQQEMDAGHYDRAAELFLDLVHKNPQHEFADKALNNAAVCFEKVRRFDSALKTYERITAEYPKSTLADQALFRVASDAEQSYDFDKAVSRYLLLVDKYPNSKNRSGALYNAARLLEGLQRYPEAASAYKRYAETFPKETDAPQNLFRSALVYEKMKDYPGEIRALEEFNRKFDRDRTQAELVVQSRFKMAQAYGASHNDKARVKLLKETVTTYDRLRLGPDKLLGADAAAEAQFELLEEQFLAYDRLKIQGSKSVLTRSFTQKTEAAKKLRQEYLELVRYKRPEWILAAFYRKANVLEHFANSIYDAPVPPEIKNLGEEAIGIYQEALANKATSLESQAVDDYVKTMEEARRLHIVNQWTKKTLESLNRYRPKDYPVLRDPREALAVEILSPMPLALAPEGFRGSVAGPSGGKLGGGK